MTKMPLSLTQFLLLNGPNGWYSHFWMSRALQSFSSTMPNTCCSASAALIGSPSVLPRPITYPCTAVQKQLFKVTQSQKKPVCAGSTT